MGESRCSIRCKEYFREEFGRADGSIGDDVTFARDAHLPLMPSLNRVVTVNIVGGGVSTAHIQPLWHVPLAPPPREALHR